MARPQKNRKVNTPPLFTNFKPAGISAKNLEQIILTLDEFEAIRLSDYLGMSQEEAATEMEISRPTFTRLIEVARKKTADFFINGKILHFEGGNIHFRKNILKCETCGHSFHISFNTEIKHCPHCGSSRLINLAGGFGHGRCCVD
ncbi:MAG: DUF134 domain-containing protein [Chlorobi bacterium]|nr:DUF134 domain-containing protein [Chlorobiota bacterium]